MHIYSIHTSLESTLAAGRGSKTGKYAMTDCGAFDGFLKQVESMHTQGKASFEDEFNVSHNGYGLFVLLFVDT